MTSSLRLRAATLTLALAAATSVGAVVAAPAQAAPAGNPCASFYRAYQTDKTLADNYYAAYKHLTGSARTRAYNLYLAYRAMSQQDLQNYNTCNHNH